MTDHTWEIDKESVVVPEMVRLECLKLAQEAQRSMDPYPITTATIERARAYVGFVLGAAEKASESILTGARPPPPNYVKDD